MKCQQTNYSGWTTKKNVTIKNDFLFCIIFREHAIPLSQHDMLTLTGWLVVEWCCLNGVVVYFVVDLGQNIFFLHLFCLLFAIFGKFFIDHYNIKKTCKVHTYIVDKRLRTKGGKIYYFMYYTMSQ